MLPYAGHSEYNSVQWETVSEDNRTVYRARIVEAIRCGKRDFHGVIRKLHWWPIAGRGGDEHAGPCRHAEAAAAQDSDCPGSSNADYPLHCGNVALSRMHRDQEINVLRSAGSAIAASYMPCLYSLFLSGSPVGCCQFMYVRGLIKKATV